jgi:hypothetical protein
MHHITTDLGRYQFPTYLVQGGAIVIGNRNDKTLSAAHTRYYFVQDNGLAVPD